MKSILLSKKRREKKQVPPFTSLRKWVRATRKGAKMYLLVFGQVFPLQEQCGHFEMKSNFQKNESIKSNFVIDVYVK